MKRSKKAIEKRKAYAELDGLVKQIVLLRDGARCAKCGGTENLQAAHIKSKGVYGRIRFYPYNVIILCTAHHIFGWHDEPHDYLVWFEEKWPGRLQRLQELAATAPKIDVPLTRIALVVELEELLEVKA